MDAADDASIISIKDSDSAYSFTTLIEDDTTGKKEATSINQSQVCHLFVNHFKEGVSSHMAKKLYVNGLKEKPADSPTVVFEKKQTENMNEKKEITLDKTSLKRRSTSDVPVLEKRKCDVNIKSKTKETESGCLTKRRNTTYPTANLNSQLKNTHIVTPIQPVAPTTSNRSVLNVSGPRILQRPSSPKRSSAISSTSNSQQLKRPSTSHISNSSSAKRPKISHERSPTSHRRPSVSSKRPPTSKQPSSSAHGTSHQKVKIHRSSSSTQRHSSESKNLSKEHGSPNARNVDITKCELENYNSTVRNGCDNSSLLEIDIFSGEPATTPVEKIKSKWSPNIQIGKVNITSPNHDDENNNNNKPKKSVYKFKAPSTSNNESTRVAAHNQQSRNQAAYKSRTALTSTNEVAKPKITSTNQPTIVGIKVLTNSNNESTRTVTNHNQQSRNEAVDKMKTASTSKHEVVTSKTTSHRDAANKNRVKLLPGNSTSNSKSDVYKEPKSVSNSSIPKKSLNHDGDNLMLPGTSQSFLENSAEKGLTSCTNKSNIVSSNNSVTSGAGKSQIQCKIDYCSIPKRLLKLNIGRLSVSRKKQIIHDKDGSYGVWFRSDRKRCKIRSCGKEGKQMKKVETSDGQDDSAQPNDSHIHDLTRNDTQTRNFTCQTDADDTVNRLSEEHALNIQHKEKMKKQALSIEEKIKKIEKQASTIGYKDKQINNQAVVIQEKEEIIKTQSFTIEQKDKQIKNQASTIEDKDKLIKSQVAAIEENEKMMKTQSFVIEDKQKNIEEQAAIIEDYKEKIQKQAFNIEDNDKRIAVEMIKIEDLERKIKEINEKNKSLQNQATELNQKNKEVERLSLEHDKIVEELKQKNKEQEQKLAETITNYELKLQMQEQKLIEQRDIIASQVNAIAQLVVSERNCVQFLTRQREYCDANHAQKRKPNKKSTLPQAQLTSSIPNSNMARGSQSAQQQSLQLTSPIQNPSMACGSQSVQQQSLQLTSPIQNPYMGGGSQSVQQQSFQPTPPIQNPYIAGGSRSVQQQSFNLSEAAMSNHNQYSLLRLVDIGKLTQNVPSLNRSPRASHSSNSSQLQNALTSPVIVSQPPSIGTITSTAVSTATPNINVPVLISTPHIQWTVEATLPSMPLLEATNQVQQHNDMYNVVPSTSTSTQVNNPALNYSQPQQQLLNGVVPTSAASTAVSRISCPHQLLPRQPQRSTSMSSSKTNRFVTIMPQIEKGTSLYHPDSCSAQDDQSNQSVINSDENYQQESQQFRSRLINRSRTLVYNDRRQYEQQLQNNIIQMRTERLQRTQNELQQFQNQSHQQSHMQQDQERQALLERQLQAYKSVQQQEQSHRQPLFYCLACNKTANLVCKTCRNCCSCSDDFCYDLLKMKHESQCTQPTMVPIIDILIN